MSESDDRVVVIGIGADGLDGLSPAARRRLAEAEVLYGSPRQLELVPADAVRAAVLRLVWPSPLLPALRGLIDEHSGRRRCVLASGDPMFFGIGSTLTELLGPDRVQVWPQPSSASLACARLGWPLESTPVLSVVGRPIAAIARALGPGRRFLVLSADQHSPSELAALLTDRGYGPSALVVLAELGGPAERSIAGTAAGWRAEVPALNIVAVECVPESAVDAGLAATGLPDAAYEHDGQLTKRDVRAVTLARLAPAGNQLLWDVGAGSGSIGIEWLRSEPSGSAIAIEADQTRADRIAANAARLGVPSLRLVRGSAPQALSGLPRPDAIFVGGGVSAAGLLEYCWAALAPGGRLVANGVTLESEAVLLRWFSEVGGELTRIAISAAAPVGRLTGWRPAMPITQLSAVKR
jgi:precorrin-6Y C5,15-methyltransferase (decarboxylating)